MGGGRSALTFGVVVALIAGVTLGNGGASVMPVFVDDFAARFGMSDAGAGLVAAAQLMATAVLTLTLAKRAARPGRAKMARLGLVVAALGFLGTAWAPDEVTLILANLILGAGLGAVYAAATAALAAADDVDRASAATVIGTVCLSALLILAVSAANSGWGGGTGFVVMALSCVPAWLLVRRLPDGPGSAGDAPVEAESAESAKPSVILLIGTALLWAVTQGAWSYASVLGREHTGMSSSAVSAVLAVSSIVALAGAVLGPVSARRFGRMRSMAAFVSGQALAMAVLIWTRDPMLFTVAAVLWQACQLAVLVQMLAAAAVLDTSGRLVASLGGAGALGTGIGPLVVGVILDGAGAGVLSIVLAVGTFVTSFPLLRMTVASAAVARTEQAGHETKRTTVA
ncbi:MFS transporter [Streptomyces sp. DT2A-34]|uniref:MFS transporter n=1 Tax=Streptomyces sp. DT2A-34 TaxID=3051182 RepID=UPI00265C3F96|nr:MFS transporter [Streptomyces sp. DT2A-34]MDO0916652.1 MFS transporter [Streptomyces sp. DT2A-34]